MTRPVDPPLPDGVHWLAEPVIATRSLTVFSSRTGDTLCEPLLALCVAARHGGRWLDHHVVPHKVVVVTEEGAGWLPPAGLRLGIPAIVALINRDYTVAASDAVHWERLFPLLRETATTLEARLILLDLPTSFAALKQGPSAKSCLACLQGLCAAGVAVVCTVYSPDKRGRLNTHHVLYDASDVQVNIGPPQACSPAKKG